jgi:hypothetical protein
VIYILIAVLALGTLVFKTMGPLLAGGRQPPAALMRVIDHLTPALLASLVVVSTVGDGRSVVLDARLAGVVVGLGLLLFRAPLLVALLAAAAATAGWRALG